MAALNKKESVFKIILSVLIIAFAGMTFLKYCNVFGVSIISYGDGELLQSRESISSNPINNGYIEIIGGVFVILLLLLIAFDKVPVFRIVLTTIYMGFFLLLPCIICGIYNVFDAVMVNPSTGEISSYQQRCEFLPLWYLMFGISIAVLLIEIAYAVYSKREKNNYSDVKDDNNILEND